jgi:hypothetical protein
MAAGGSSKDPQKISLKPVRIRLGQFRFERPSIWGACPVPYSTVSRSVGTLREAKRL